MFYEQKASTPSSLDLSFDDEILEQVENRWRQVIGDHAEGHAFMQFEGRKGMEAEDQDDNDY